jgi:molybdopterin molybdotransferase
MPEPETPLSERPWEDVERLLSVDDARERVITSVAPLAPVELPLLAARGLILSEAVTAACDVPPFRNSAMDGYAVRAADTSTASIEAPVRLRVAGVQAAGSPPQHALVPGTSVRIMTGAPLPDGRRRRRPVRGNGRGGDREPAGTDGRGPHLPSLHASGTTSGMPARMSSRVRLSFRPGVNSVLPTSVSWRRSAKRRHESIAGRRSPSFPLGTRSCGLGRRLRQG